MPTRVDILIQEYEDQTEENETAGKVPTHTKLAQLWIPSGKPVHAVRVDYGTHFVFPPFMNVVCKSPASDVNDPKVLLDTGEETC